MVRIRKSLVSVPGADASTFTFDKIQRVTVPAQIITQIEQGILSGSFGEGGRLPAERVLAETFQVSRPAVREALKALEYIGIVETRPGDGVFVRADMEVLNNHLRFARMLRRYTLEEMIETRRVVEAATVQFAVERGSPDDIEVLTQRFAESVEKMDDVMAFLDADFRFHQTIAEIAGNSILLDVLNAMRELTIDANCELLKIPGRNERASAFHDQILQAITSRDAAAASAAMEAHLNDVFEEIGNIYADSQGDPKRS